MRETQLDSPIIFNMMSYRDPETPSKKPTHRRQFSYDADEEDHLDFNPNDFTLPDGTQPLDPAAIQRIENATKMLRELEFNKEMYDMVGATPSGESSASNKENEEPASALKSDDVDYDADEDDMIFGETATAKGKGKEPVRYGAGETAMEEDAQTDDTLRIAPQTSGSTSKGSQKECATSLEEASTEIWLLKSIVKDQKREIEELRRVIADQAAQAKKGGKLGLFDQLKYPSFTLGIDDRDSPFYSRPSRYDPDETVEEDFKPKRPRKENMPLFFKKTHKEQRKRKAVWAEDDEQEMGDFSRNSARAKKVKHKGRPFQLENTNMAPFSSDDLKFRDDATTELIMEKLGGGTFKEYCSSKGPKKETKGVAGGEFDKSENKGDMRRCGVVDAEEEIDVRNWLPTGDMAKD